MKMALRLVLLAALIAAGVWLWTILFPGPEKIVRKRLAQAASEASFKSGENPLVSAARAETLAGFFSTNVEVNIDLPEHGQHRRPVAHLSQSARGHSRRIVSYELRS